MEDLNDSFARFQKLSPDEQRFKTKDASRPSLPHESEPLTPERKRLAGNWAEHIAGHFNAERGDFDEPEMDM